MGGPEENPRAIQPYKDSKRPYLPEERKGGLTLKALVWGIIRVQGLGILREVFGGVLGLGVLGILGASGPIK